MAEEAQAAQQESAAKKRAKVNRITLDELNKKIEEMEQAGQTKSRYYIHLTRRRQEMQSPK